MSVVRLALPNDLDAIVQLRLRLFENLTDFNHGKSHDQQLRDATRTYFSHAFNTQDCQTWVAEAAGSIVATGSLAIFTRPPYPGNPMGRNAYLLNMYTLPEYRKQGLAKAILQQAMQYAREQGFGKIWLHASDDGQALYAASGFVTSADYMEWEIPCP